MTTPMAWGVALAVTLAAVGCAVKGEKFESGLQTLPPSPPGQGRIFIYRVQTFTGLRDAIIRVPKEIRLNGRFIGHDNPGAYFYIDHPPGNCEIVCAGRSLGFTLSAGETRYVHIRLMQAWESTGFVGGMVWGFQPTLEGDTHGTAMLQKCRFIGGEAAGPK